MTGKEITILVVVCIIFFVVVSSALAGDARRVPEVRAVPGLVPLHTGRRNLQLVPRDVGQRQPLGHRAQQGTNLQFLTRVDDRSLQPIQPAQLAFRHVFIGSPRRGSIQGHI